MTATVFCLCLASFVAGMFFTAGCNRHRMAQLERQRDKARADAEIADEARRSEWQRASRERRDDKMSDALRVIVDEMRKGS